MKTIAVIPVRVGSTRFPNKIFAPFMKKTVLQHVIDLAKKLDFIDKLVVATDSEDVSVYCANLGVESWMTPREVRCGSERVFAFYQEHNTYDYYVSIPADEPTLDPFEINKVWTQLMSMVNCDYANIVATLYSNFYCLSDLIKTESCKMVMSGQNVLYFSRAVIPCTKTGGLTKSLDDYKRHVGLFLFSRCFMSCFGAKAWNEDESMLADSESLEQNRFLELGMTVRAVKINHKGFGIDIPQQVAELEKRMTEE